MAKDYRLTLARRLANRVVSALVRRGWSKGTYLLTVPGRKTGRLYTTPVTLVENGERFLVAPYGAVGWVRNARAAGRVTLTRGAVTETVDIEELGPDEAAPVLRRYVRMAPVGAYFDATRRDPVEAFRAEAHRHPVFRLLTPPG